MLDDIGCFSKKKDVAETFLADGLEKFLADVKILYVGGDVKKGVSAGGTQSSFQS
jgi:hypothetical protein